MLAGSTRPTDSTAPATFSLPGSTDEVLSMGDGDRLATAGDVEFVHHRRDVVFHGAVRDGQPCRDVGVAEPFGEKDEHLVLAYGKACGVARGRWSRAPGYGGDAAAA